jgi:hypothetical protein
VAIRWCVNNITKKLIYYHKLLVILIILIDIIGTKGKRMISMDMTAVDAANQAQLMTQVLA